MHRNRCEVVLFFLSLISSTRKRVIILECKFSLLPEFKKDWAKPPNLITEFRLLLCFLPAILLLWPNSWLAVHTVAIVMPIMFSLVYFSHWLASLLGMGAEWQVICQYITSTNFISVTSVAVLQQRLAAMFIFIVAALTDKLDGYMARKWDWITKFGTILDPIVDKLLVIPSLFALSYIYFPVILWVPTAIITVREVYVALCQNYFRKLNIQIEVIYSGKVKMVIQCMSISLFFLPLVGLWQLIPWTSIIYATYSTIKSGIDYHKEFVKAWKELKKLSGRDL